MDTTERARLRALCEGAATWQQIGMSGATILSLLDALDAAERERDEARAEVERLRAAVNEALLIAHTAPPPVHAAHWCLRLVETLHNALKTDGAP